MINNSAVLTLQWAAKYISLGWSVIPLKPRSKEPLVPWQRYQTQKPALEEIRDWLKKWPEMNLGIVTGAISNIVVVDLDGSKGQMFGIAQKLVSNIVSKTGNGKQLFYKWTEHVDNSVAKIAPGVDIRGDGGYVVVSPSIHPNGKRYRWERFVPTTLVQLPDIGIRHSADVSVTGVKKPEGWIAKALEEMKIGNIDDTLVSILGRLRRDGYSSNDAYALLSPAAKEAGATEGHLEDKIRNIWSRYEPKQNMLRGGNMYSEQRDSFLHIHSPDNDDSYNRYHQSLLVSEQSINGHLHTGFPTLDKYFEGGLKSERLFTVAARTGTGKTNFAIALSTHLCLQGKKVLYFSTEFRYEKIWARYIAALSGTGDFRKHPFFVCDSFSPNIEQVEEAIKRIMPDVFIFDHINHIGEDRETLGMFMQGCNFLQRKYNSQGVLVAQLSRAADFVENGKRVEPRMSMIKGSGTIEQASSRVLLLSEIRVTPEMNEIVGVLDKNDTGDKGVLTFALKKNPYRFEELL